MPLKLTCCLAFSRAFKLMRASVLLFLISACVSFCPGEQGKTPILAKPIANFTDVAE